MEKIVFLDRDGTLNEEVNYLHRPEDMHLLAGAIKRSAAAGNRESVCFCRQKSGLQQISPIPI